MRNEVLIGGVCVNKIRKLFHNKKFLFICTLVLVFATVLFCYSIPVFGDVGNHVSRSSDSSGGSYHSSGGSDSDGGFIWLLIWLIIEHPLIGIPLVIVLFVFRKRIFGKTESVQKNMQVNNQPPIDYGDNNLQELIKNDPNFSEPQFIAKVNNMYLQLQDAWMRKDWKGMRALETDELFNMHAKQLQRYIDNHETNVVENICILKTQIVKYEQDAVNDIITVRLETRINDYIIDDKTRQVKAGNPNKEIYMTYHWKLIRRKGVLTQVNNKMNAVTQCPNCGANISINASGECEYCGSIISNGQYDWVLSSIESVRQY